MITFSLNIYTPIICAAQITGLYIYIDTREKYYNCNKRNINSMQAEVFPGKRVSLGDIIPKIGLGIFLGEHS